MEYNDGFRYAIYFNRTALRFIGLWPESNDGIIFKTKGWLNALLIFIVLYLPEMSCTYVYWGDMNAVIASLTINGPILLAITKVISVRKHREVLRYAIVSMVADWSASRSKEEYQEMLKTAKISRFISALSTVISNSLFIAFTFFRIWESIQMSKRTDLDPRLSFNLLYPGYMPYDAKKIKYFIPTWLIQFFATFISINAYASFDTFVSAVILHVCGQLNVIAVSLKNLVNEQSQHEPKQFWANYSEIIQHHDRVNNLGKVIEESFNKVLLLQMMICTVTLCFQFFVIITILIDPSAGKVSPLEVLFSITFTIYTVSHLFLFCYVGNFLSIESTKIGQAYYLTEWYNLPVKKARSLMFTAHRARKPLILTAGRFCVFSRNLFVSILRTSFGYLSMLLAVKQNKNT